MIIQTIYLLASFIAVAATIPQIKQLLATKESDELNLASWSTWTMYQVVATMYAVSIGAWLYVIVSSAWVIFYIAMVTLIIRYRRPVIRYRAQKRLGNPAPVTVASQSFSRRP